MAGDNLNNIFLSASIPTCEDRDPKYFKTADIIAIRDSIKALATVVIPKTRLVWGGHPAITPLIHYVMNRMRSNVKNHIRLYQTNFFKELFPKDNKFIEDVRIIKENKDRDSSLYDMRCEMIKKNNFVAGIFIGGMDGGEIEYDMFQETHPNAKILPIASTGAAARFIYDKMQTKLDKSLLNDYAYMNLFRTILSEYLT